MKEAIFLGSTLVELRAFPKEVRDEIGFSIETAQIGGKAINVVPLVGFKGAGVLEVISDFDTNTYRAVYTVRFHETVYVLHAFQKKSVKGIATPRREMDLVRSRLKEAQKHYEQERKQKVSEQKNVRTKG
ncbi:type II toxin-antitoxin system RelE/ParE family toxin [Mesorhizobium sp. ES1-4]|uniref:type II toxin-antitoxin system RelE/ParE family toxin n=1 Tax=Mesorhizobium sp. ES1-4 TaxID=2876627 RepID=UPI001CCB366E|nr:type II toxin-antitoxin system RelE/ParE family toxin [Mesorhizobium sp. ES1-4]MBZ9797399.1 type II toxin-antitoxin system RelE/ParE family toxin [Mesorhizobium sp. ES1-4]